MATFDSLQAEHRPLVAFGMTSLVLGSLGLVLFILPVLGVPISAFGLLFGILGVWTGLRGMESLRWSLAGTGLAALALVVNLAITFAPAGYLPGHEQPALWQQVPNRPYMPPPEL